MNIFAFETKVQMKSFVIWTVSLLALFLLFTTVFYDAFMNSKAAVQQALDNLPPAFSAMFGVNMDTMFSYGGFFQFISRYLSLVGAMMASAIALSAFSREKRSKCVDFLFSKPVGRGEIFLVKLLSCVALIFAMNLLFITVSILSYLGNGQNSSGLGTLILASLSLLFTQLVFLALGIAYAVFARKVRSISGTATALGFAGFILMALYSLLEEDALRYISPLNYFDPGAVFALGGFEIRYIVTAAAVVVVCIVLSYLKYSRSDTQAT